MQFRNERLTRRRLLGGTAAGALLALGGGRVAATTDRHVVGLEPSADVGVATAAADAVHRTLAFGERGRAVVGRFPADTLDRLRDRPAVRYVERDGRVRALAQTTPWGVDRIDAEVCHASGDAGAGTDVAVVDTGIDSDHPDLQANLGRGKAFVSCSGDCDRAWDDDNGHGTHCAGTVAAVDDGEGVVGVAPEATLHAVKVLNDWGGGSYSDVAAGIEYVADQGWDVANVSLGGSSGSSVVEDAVEYAAASGVFVAASAGGSGPCSDCVGYPAAYDEAVAVGATNCQDEIASYSSRGPQLELVAPGSSVRSTSDDGGYDTLSGTSMATAHVAGAAALVMAEGKSASETRSILCASAENLGEPASAQGCGLVDPAAALGHDSGDDGAC